MLKGKLDGSSLGNQEIIKSMIEAFEKEVSLPSSAIDGWTQL
jgi:hypothetical protein